MEVKVLAGKVFGGDKLWSVKTLERKKYLAPLKKLVQNTHSGQNIWSVKTLEVKALEGKNLGG